MEHKLKVSPQLNFSSERETSRFCKCANNNIELVPSAHFCININTKTVSLKSYHMTPEKRLATKQAII